MDTPELLDPERLQQIIEAGIPEAAATVTDLTGTRDHYRVDVVSDEDGDDQ